MQVKQFRKNKEDFVCEKCGTEVKGTGYTNHCPNCLWSKHVDIFPGDRLGECEGLMEPIGIELAGKNYIINYRCEKCGFENRNKASDNDNFDVIVNLSKAKL